MSLPIQLDLVPHADCVRYSVQLVPIDRTWPSTTDPEQRHHNLLRSEVQALHTPAGMKWITTGWVNPLAPNQWKDA